MGESVTIRYISYTAKDIDIEQEVGKDLSLIVLHMIFIANVMS